MGTLKNHHSKNDVISIRYEEIRFRPWAPFLNGREHGMPLWTAIGGILEGPTLAKMGRVEQALQQIEAGPGWCDSSKQVAFHPRSLLPSRGTTSREARR